MTKQLMETDENFNFDLYQKTAEELVRAMDAGLNFSSTAGEEEMAKIKSALRANLFEFATAKTQSQFKHLRDLLLTDKNQINSFETVRKTVANEGYVFNNNYLKTELNLTKQATIMAVKWQELDSEYLQFSTVGDNRVRPEHQKFDKFTAKKSDAIWRRLYTPLDWGCRCTIIPGKETGLSETYNSKWANNVVDPLVKNTIFDNNVGITLKIFNKTHPYYNDSEQVNPVSARKEKDKEIKDWSKTNIPESGKVVKASNFKTGEVIILRKNVKGIADHFTEPKYKDFAKDIFPIIKKCNYFETATLDESHKGKLAANIERKKARGVTDYNYYQFTHKKEKFRLNVEVINGKEYPFSINKIVKAE